MRKFTINSIIFLLILVVLNFMIYNVLNRLYWRNYKQVDVTFNIFLLADSHGTPLGKFVEEFGVYNFSAGSDSYIDMHRKAKFLIKNSSIDTLLITVDDHTLSPYREKMNNKDRSVYFTDKSDFVNVIQFIIEKHIKNLVVLFNPKARDIYRSYLISRVTNLINLKQDEQSWQSLDIDHRKKRVISRAKTQFPDSTKSLRLNESLQGIIDICQENDIVLIGIKFPLTKEYLEEIDEKSFHADSTLIKRSIPVYDFSHLYIGNSSYFSNEDHLNIIGGKKFAENLMRVIRK